MQATDDSVNDQSDITISAGGVGTTELGDDAITNEKMAENSVDSDQYVNASIDHAHLSDGIIEDDNVATDADIALSKLSDSDTLLTINSTDYSIGDSLTIASGSGHTIQDDGTDLTARDNLNFVDP